MFTVNCSAYSYKPGTRPLLPVINEFGDIFSLTATCSNTSGCSVSEVEGYEYGISSQYEGFGRLTSCNLSGDLHGEKFTILNYTKYPFTCNMGSYGWQSCELRINLPINVSSGNITAIETQATNKGIFDEFICFVKNLLGGTC